MLCLQVFVFVIELRDRDGLVSDCFYYEWGVGQAQLY